MTQQPDVKINSSSLGEVKGTAKVVTTDFGKDVEDSLVETPGQKVSLGTQVKTDTKVNRSVQDNIKPKEISLTSSMVFEGDDALEIIKPIIMDPKIIKMSRTLPEDAARERVQQEEIIAEYIRKYVKQSFNKGMIILDVKFKERTIISGWVGLNKTEYYELIILEMIELAIKEDLTMLV